MKEKILIVEDGVAEADHLHILLTQAGYSIIGVAHSVAQASEMMKQARPDIILLDIFLKEMSTGAEDQPMKTIHENERDYIITVLKKCHGKIWGAGGAAGILNIPPSTLKSKMKKLGIRKEYIA
jgi:DNA-binding NtrC family response regulator